MSDELAKLLVCNQIAVSLVQTPGSSWLSSSPLTRVDRLVQQRVASVCFKKGTAYFGIMVRVISHCSFDR